jgi:hypothetical protein
MAHGKKPTGKHTLTLHFDSKVGVENFIAWYLDGGGEQDSEYYSIAWGKDWIHVKPSDEACPKCEHTRSAEDADCDNCDYKVE